MKMEDNDQRAGKEEVDVAIDTDQYEYRALLGMKLGRDNVNEFINDVLWYQLKKLQEEE